MIILSAGMPKSGSGYIYNVLNEMIIASGCSDARDIKQRFQLENIMRGYNNNIGRLNLNKLLKLYRVSLQAGLFCAKTHAAPHPLVRPAIEFGMMGVIYIYRDPRDVILSVIDHGRKLLGEGKKHTFAQTADFDSAFCRLPNWFNTWSIYQELPGAINLKYEGLIQEPLKTVRNIAEFFKLRVDEQRLRDILWKYSRFNPAGERKGLHYNKGKAFRYIREMSSEQKKRFIDQYGTIIMEMGYSIEMNEQDSRSKPDVSD